MTEKNGGFQWANLNSCMRTFFLKFQGQSSTPGCIKKTNPIGLQINTLRPVRPHGGTHPSPPRSLRRLQQMFSPYSLVNTLGICPWPKWLSSESNTDKNVCVNPTWGAIFLLSIQAWCVHIVPQTWSSGDCRETHKVKYEHRGWTTPETAISRVLCRRSALFIDCVLSGPDICLHPAWSCQGTSMQQEKK